MDFQKIYDLTVGKEIQGYLQTQGTLNNLKTLNGIINPNSRYRIVEVPGPDGQPAHFLFNIDLDELMQDFKINNLQQILQAIEKQKIKCVDTNVEKWDDKKAAKHAKSYPQQVAIEPEE